MANLEAEAAEAAEPQHRGRAVTHTIGVIRGDGTGPEVVGEGAEGPRGPSSVEGSSRLVEFDLGAERYLRTGDVLPDDELERVCGTMDAILPGCGRRPATCSPASSNATCCCGSRFELDPVREPPARSCGTPASRRLVPSHGEDDVNMVVVRENSEGLYTGAGGFHRKGTRARGRGAGVDQHAGTASSGSSATRFELAMRPERRRKLTLVHKTNVLTFAGDLYQRVVDEVGGGVPRRRDGTTSTSTRRASTCSISPRGST